MPNKYSFAEKKRIRNSFEKISSVMNFPDILEVQTNSYKEFLQSHLSPKERQNQGLHEYSTLSSQLSVSQVMQKLHILVTSLMSQNSM